MSEHDFCRTLLSIGRRDARKEGRATDLGCGVLGPYFRSHYIVESANGKILFDGTACCKFEARYKAIAPKETIIVGTVSPVAVTVTR